MDARITLRTLNHYEAALLLAREHGDRVQEGVILNGLGVTLSKLNRPEEARTVLEESVTLNRETGQRLLEAHAQAGLGHVSRSLGRFDRAAESFEQSRSFVARPATGSVKPGCGAGSLKHVPLSEKRLRLEMPPIRQPRWRPRPATPR